MPRYVNYRSPNPATVLTYVSRGRREICVIDTVGRASIDVLLEFRVFLFLGISRLSLFRPESRGAIPQFAAVDICRHA